jgi:hypothetical protein
MLEWISQFGQRGLNSLQMIGYSGRFFIFGVPLILDVHGLHCVHNYTLWGYYPR